MKENIVMATRDNTAIVMAAESGYAYDGYKSENYNVFCSYKHIGLFLRCVREIYFMIPFLPQTIWYDKKIISFNPKFIIIRDAIITKQYLVWLQRVFPNSQINFVYENMVGRAKHIMPNQIPKGIRIWTYDSGDSETYLLNLTKTMAYFSSFIMPKGDVKYDVLFVGKDKGRGDWLIELEKYLNQKGYRTKFIITKDTKLSREKPYYKKEVPYSQIADWVSHSRCIINVSMPGQKGITVRDMESLFNKVKLITTNESIKDVSFYNPRNIFIITKENWGDIPNFLDDEYDDSISIDLSLHSVDAVIRKLTC